MFSFFKSWLFIVLLLIAGPVLFAGAQKSGREFKTLQTYGKDAVGLITTIHWNEKRGSSSGFKADVTFQTEDGRTGVAKVKIPADLGRQLKSDQGDPVVKLRYLPSDLSKAQLADATDDSGETKGIGIGSLVLGILLAAWRLRGRSSSSEKAVTA